MYLVNQNYFVYLIISLNVSQKTSGFCQTPGAENFAKVFTGLIRLNILALDLSLHLPSADFN